MKAVIAVTAEDISNGKQNTCTGCPISLAIERFFGCAATVGSMFTRLYIGTGTEQVVKTPSECVSFIERYDVGAPSYPFEFTLDVPSL